MESIPELMPEEFTMTEHIALEEKLAKLERNETQMDQRQRERYARPLEKLRKEICAGALRLMMFEADSRILQIDSGSRLAIEAKEQTEKFIEEARKTGTLAKAEKILLETYDAISYCKFLRPLIDRIRYVAYAPYFVSKTRIDEDGRYTNDVINATFGERHHYCAEIGLWQNDKSGLCLLVGLPPTMEAISRQYEQRQARWVSEQRNGNEDLASKKTKRKSR